MVRRLKRFETEKRLTACCLPGAMRRPPEYFYIVVDDTLENKPEPLNCCCELVEKDVYLSEDSDRRVRAGGLRFLPIRPL